MDSLTSVAKDSQQRARESLEVAEFADFVNKKRPRDVVERQIRETGEETAELERGLLSHINQEDITRKNLAEVKGILDAVCGDVGRFEAGA
jgi:hypothetical protein